MYRGNVTKILLFRLGGHILYRLLHRQTTHLQIKGSGLFFKQGSFGHFHRGTRTTRGRNFLQRTLHLGEGHM